MPIRHNLQTYAPLPGGAVLMALSKVGADRCVMHEALRRLSLTAWSDVQWEIPTLPELVAHEALYTRYLPETSCVH
jgi:hypothetical protein